MTTMATYEPSISGLSGSTAAYANVSSIPVPAQSPSIFTLPTYTSFPPFYTLQPNLTTRARQLGLWSTLVTSYCAYHHIFRLSISSLPPDLFSNASIRRSLKPADVRTVLDHMSRAENGGKIEWLPAASKNEQSSLCCVYWRSLGEWADLMHGWVDETGQKGTVLTVYELREGEAVQNKEWKGMDEGMMRKVLNVLVKNGKAQIFGQADGEGVKFY